MTSGVIILSTYLDAPSPMLSPAVHIWKSIPQPAGVYAKVNGPCTGGRTTTPFASTTVLLTPAEVNDIAAQHPTLVKEMQAGIREWIKDKPEPAVWGKDYFKELKNSLLKG